MYARWLLRLHLHVSISTALMRPRRPKQYCLQLDIALWCKNQIEHSIWDESQSQRQSSSLSRMTEGEKSSGEPWNRRLSHWFSRGTKNKHMIGSFKLKVCLRTFTPKSSYGEIFFISPLELVDKVLTPKMKKKMGAPTLFRRKWQWKNALISINRS